MSISVFWKLNLEVLHFHEAVEHILISLVWNPPWILPLGPNHNARPYQEAGYWQLGEKCSLQIIQRGRLGSRIPFCTESDFQPTFLKQKSVSPSQDLLKQLLRISQILGISLQREERLHLHWKCGSVGPTFCSRSQMRATALSYACFWNRKQE